MCLPMVQETGVQSQVESYQRLKMVLDAALLSPQHYKVRIMGKMEQSREWRLGVVAIEKGALGSPSTSHQLYYITAKIDKTQQNYRCRLCGDRDETLNHNAVSLRKETIRPDTTGWAKKLNLTIWTNGIGTTQNQS